MPGYIEPPLETDANELSADALDYLVDNLTGWVPQEGHLEVWLIEVLARMVAEARDVASRVPTSIFRYLGKSLVGLDPIDAAPAQVATTWTMIDNQGYTVLADTIAAFRTAGDELVAFRVVEDFTVEPGVLSTNAGAVVMEAIEDGTHANGIAAGPMEMIDPLAFVESVVSTSPVTAGGVDAESDDSYLTRLADELGISSPSPILPDDFAILARRVAGVHRSLAIDGYNPGDQTFNNQRMITVALVDADGAAVPVGVKTDVEDLLESLRELNWVVHAVDPTFVVIDVTFTAVAKSGWDAADVETRAEQAVSDYLEPSRWGGGDEDPPVWRDESVVRYLEIGALLDKVEGLDYITDLQIGEDGGAQGNANINLAGVAPLTQPGAIDGTVNNA